MTQVCRGGILLSLAVALIVQVSVGQECNWDSDLSPDQGVDPGSCARGARSHTILLNTDEESCREACCHQVDCDVIAIGTPADHGTPECHLIRWMSDGKDACVFQPDSQFKLFRRKKKGLSGDIHLEPLNAESPNADSPRATNETMNPDMCRLPARTGSCRASFPAFFYNVTAQTCQSFIYGGCDANDNNFETQEACEAACKGVTGTVLPDDPASESPGASRRILPHPADTQGLAEEGESAPASQSTASNEAPVFSDPKITLPEMAASDFAELCEATPEMGPCRASLRHWYYNTTTRTCLPFIYGGCRGNKNNYLSESSCKATCTVTVTPSPRIVPEDTAPDAKASGTFDEFCMAEYDSGKCRASFPMFYYELSTGTCHSFTYGGCGGNKNRYETMEDCMTRCSGTAGGFDSRGLAKKSWSPAPFFLVATLAVISVLLLVALVMITLRRNKIHRRLSTISDKEELLPDPDEQSSVESLPVQGSPKISKA